MTIKVLLNGAPVAGAFVTAHVPKYLGLIGGYDASGTTDANGNWNEPGPGLYALGASEGADVSATYQGKYGATGELTSSFLSWVPSILTLNLTTNGYSVANADQGVEQQASQTSFLGLSQTEIIAIALGIVVILVVSEKV